MPASRCTMVIHGGKEFIGVAETGLWARGMEGRRERGLQRNGNRSIHSLLLIIETLQGYHEPTSQTPV